MANTTTDRMNKQANQMNQQFQSLFFGPMRSYATLTVEYAERVLNTQYEFAKAYSNASFSQARSMLNIKNSDDLRSFVESQQQVAQKMGERLKDDTKKVVAMNQEFAEKSQQLVEENVKSANQTAQQNVQKAAK
ncbi:phasin family protein [Halomonas sp. PR-M31]|uniref:phasin family protein n=1 Tax=Halomonas sp. PR-M31 TaxID=1471202 RepID=UPI000AC5EFD8|nr:phasin family protein [Halomonas sp. PR-M31]